MRGTVLNEKPKWDFNVGTEGTRVRVELHKAHELIEKNCDPVCFSFVGFVEGGDISADKADVIVTDGLLVTLPSKQVREQQL